VTASDGPSSFRIIGGYHKITDWSDKPIKRSDISLADMYNNHRRKCA